MSSKKQPDLRRPILGERLVQARQAKNLTQGQLAEKIGVSQRVISHWERFAVAIKSDNLIALADALEVSTDYLLGREKSLKKLL